MVCRGGDRTVTLSNRDSSHQDAAQGRKRLWSPSSSSSRTEVSSCRTNKSHRSHLERCGSVSWERISGEDGSDGVVSLKIQCISECGHQTSKGVFTSVNPCGKSLAQASMVHLSQAHKPQKYCHNSAMPLTVCMVAQGAKKVDKLCKTPLCEHTSRDNACKFLKLTEVFNNLSLKDRPRFWQSHKASSS